MTEKSEAKTQRHTGPLVNPGPYIARFFIFGISLVACFALRHLGRFFGELIKVLLIPD